MVLFIRSTTPHDPQTFFHSNPHTVFAGARPPWAMARLAIPFTGFFTSTILSSEEKRTVY